VRKQDTNQDRGPILSTIHDIIVSSECALRLKPPEPYTPPPPRHLPGRIRDWSS